MAFVNGPRIVTDGLVLSLDAGDRNSYPGSGTIWRDLSGGNITGSLITGSSFSSNNQGIITLNGTNGRIDIQPSSRYKVQFPLTISLIFRLDSIPTSSYMTLIETDNALTSYHAGVSMIVTNAAIISAGYGDNTQNNAPGRRTYTTTTTVSANTWYSLVAVLPDNLTLNMYLNGVQISSSYSSGTSTTLAYSSDPASLGYSNDGVYQGFLSGSIANVQIYNRALSAQEILQNYNATKTRFGL